LASAFQWHCAISEISKNEGGFLRVEMMMFQLTIDEWRLPTGHYRSVQV
jgi:hypothetical protein